MWTKLAPSVTADCPRLPGKGRGVEGMDRNWEGRLGKEHTTCAIGQVCAPRAARCACQCFTTVSPREKKKALMYSICQFLWGAKSHHGQVQGIPVNSVDLALARDAHSWLLWIGRSWLHRECEIKSDSPGHKRKVRMCMRERNPDEEPPRHKLGPVT